MPGQLRLRENLSRVDWEFVATVLSAVAMLIWSLLCDGQPPTSTHRHRRTWTDLADDLTTVWIIRELEVEHLRQPARVRAPLNARKEFT